MIKFTVDRKKWSRGLSGANKLLNGPHNRVYPEGTMCCFGFLCKTLGLKDEQILGVGAISTLVNKHGSDREEIRKIPSNLTHSHDTKSDCDSRWVIDAYHINDDKEIDDATRERKLTEIFKQNGYDIEFIN